jgi:hypothetical protein
MTFIFAQEPIAGSGHRFWLDRIPSSRSEDGWFEVSWYPNWTDVIGVQAKLKRRRQRGKWFRVTVKGEPSLSVIRRLCFSRIPQPDHEGVGAYGVAVRLTWDDQMLLLDDDRLMGTVPIELELSHVRWSDWPRILARRPRQNAEAAIVGVLGALLGSIGIGLAFPGAAGRLLQGSGTSSIDSLDYRMHMLGEDKCTMVLQSVGSEAGSRGLSIECDADPSQQIALRVDGVPRAGSWTLRVDDGRTEPEWLPFDSFKAVRVTGSGRYRFLVYSDDAASSMAIKDFVIRVASQSDQDAPLVWPRSARHEDQQRFRAEWQQVLGFREADSVVTKAKAITNFVYQRSNVTRAATPLNFGDPRLWTNDPGRTIDGLCGRFGSAVLDLCIKFGIDARPVALATRQFAEGARLHDTHVLVEVFDPIPRQWILFDPTFNVVFEGPDNQLLGLEALMLIAQKGEPWRAVPVGRLREGRTLDSYYLSYADLLFMGNVPAVSRLGDVGAGFRTHPQTVSEVAKEKYPPKAGS